MIKYYACFDNQHFLVKSIVVDYSIRQVNIYTKDTAPKKIYEVLTSEQLEQKIEDFRKMNFTIVK